MKFLNTEKSSFSVEITPLIDIVFLLVIFFVVTSKVGDSQFLSLDLPKSESFQSMPNQSLNEISIISDGSVYINDQLININNTEELQNAIFLLNNTNESVILNADATAIHAWVIKIMDILGKNGFNEVQIRTIEK
jgi:biopolymer transport protein ExbD